MNKANGKCPWCGKKKLIMWGEWWNKCTVCGCIYVVLSDRIDVEGRGKRK